MDLWSNVAAMSVASFAAVAANVAGSWSVNVVLGMFAGPPLWIGFIYAGTMIVRADRSWLLRTPQGAAVLRLNGTTVHSFAAWPHGLGIGGQLLVYLTTEADRSGQAVGLRCTRADAAFYQRHGFVPIGGEHPWLPLLVRMRRPATHR